MVKEIVISVLVVVIVFSMDFFLQDYTKSTIDNITSDLQELKEELLERNEGQVDVKIAAIQEKWDYTQHKMSFYIEHDELEKVKTNLVALNGFIEVKDYGTGISELNKSVYVLEHIADKYSFSLINIF